ncbi:4-galactosyltransferase galt-1,Beta-1 [Trichinella spiralis]|uniref:Glycosyltransferase family 92 protein n=1 Tax=Trichinella spiralis TaxID=6334 RepID=A0ABR3KUU4_TRISP
MQIWQKAWDPRPNFYFPYLISCPLENGKVFPKYVTIENAQCPHGYSNLLPVVLPASVDPKRHTVVCVKGLDYSDDRSARLIEWIEANLLLGADKLAVYTYNVHPNMEKVLHYYQNKGYVLHVSSSLPGNQPHSAWQRSRFIALNSQQKRRNEILLYNDCLYRHLNSHIYVLPIDLTNCWFQLVVIVIGMKLRGNLHISVPRRMHMLRHRFRSSQISNAGYYSKCFMRVDNVETAFNHFPFHKIRTALEPTLFFATEVALKNHYKDACPKELTDDKCDKLMNDSIMDYNLAAFQQQLVHRFRKVCAELQFPTD